MCFEGEMALNEARAQLQELIFRKHSTEQMQSLVSELSLAANTLELVSSIEKAVQAAFGCLSALKCCKNMFKKTCKNG